MRETRALLINQITIEELMSSKPKYLLDQMFNGLVEVLRAADYDCDTATHTMLGTNDSRVGIPDAEIIQFLQRNGSSYILVTADMRFARKCLDLGISCIGVDQKELVISHLKSHM
jgi:rRNA-processing protein FCF1